jgi:molybdenum cofactor biosynthesis protein B
MVLGSHNHKASAPKSVKLGIISLSSTRNLDQDVSGHWIKETALSMGHEVVCHQVAPDDAIHIFKAVDDVLKTRSPGVLILTGGTGISPKDVTLEALRPHFEKELTAFSVIFAQLSYQDIGPATLLSRATAGIIGKTAIFCLPGSLKACQLACNTLIFPEIGHLIKHLSE